MNRLLVQSPPLAPYAITWYRAFTMINIEVTRHGNENVAGLMRRFSRKVQSSGVIKRMRGIRYHTRAASNAQTHKDALTRIRKTNDYIELYKQGREPQKGKRR